jgi:hypothetical protein
VPLHIFTTRPAVVLMTRLSAPNALAYGQAAGERQCGPRVDGRRRVFVPALRDGGRDKQQRGDGDRDVGAQRIDPPPVYGRRRLALATSRGRGATPHRIRAE